MQFGSQWPTEQVLPVPLGPQEETMQDNIGVTIRFIRGSYRVDYVVMYGVVEGLHMGLGFTVWGFETPWDYLGTLVVPGFSFLFWGLRATGEQWGKGVPR